MLSSKHLAATCLILHILLITSTTITEASIETQPLNAAVNIGEKGIFNCTSNVPALPTWRYKVSAGDTATLITAIGTCISLFPSRFFTESTGPGNCNLIVLNATISDALIYNCIDSKLAEKEAMLIVIESVSVSTTTDEPLLEEAVNITCSVRYAAPNPPPNLYPEILWTNSSSSINMTGTVLTPTPPSNIVTSYVNLTAYPPTVESYWCNVYFKPPTNLIGTNSATNAPPYYRTTKSTEMSIRYNRPTVTVVTHDESGICETKLLECHPNAYPAPIDVHWLDVGRNEIVNGIKITGEFGGEYICSVTNVIEGENYTVKVTYILDDNNGAEKCYGVSDVNITISENKSIDARRSSRQIRSTSETKAHNSEGIVQYTLTCTANGVPIPRHFWTGPCLKDAFEAQQIIAVAGGTYTCLANNSINDRVFYATKTVYISGQPEAETNCPTQPDPPQSIPHDDEDDWPKILVVILVAIPGIGIIFLLCVFLPCYGCSRPHQEKINNKFPWIERALACLHKECCTYSWEVFFFIFCSVIGGIIFIPFVLIASLCCDRKSSKSSQVARYAETSAGNLDDLKTNGESLSAPYEELQKHPPVNGIYQELALHHGGGNYERDNQPTPSTASYEQIHPDAKTQRIYEHLS